MNALTAIVQQIMTGLQTADTKEAQVCCHFESSLWTDYTEIRVTIRPDHEAQSAPLSLSDPSPQGVGNSTNHQQLSHRYKLNLVISPHRARCLDLTGGLRESAAMQPVPLPLLVPRTSSWRRRQYGPLKRWYTTATLHDVPTQKTKPWISLPHSACPLE